MVTKITCTATANPIMLIEYLTLTYVGGNITEDNYHHAKKKITAAVKASTLPWGKRFKFHHEIYILQHFVLNSSPNHTSK